MMKWKKTAVSLLAVLLLMSQSMEVLASNRGTNATSAKSSGKSSTSSASSSGKGSTSSAASSGKGGTSSGKIAGLPEASGKAVEKNESAVIDYSNIVDGYVMVNYTASTKDNLKVQVVGPSTTYTYDLEAKDWTTFPLSDGNGNYKVTVYKSMANSKYSTVLAASFKVTLDSEFAPFLHANQYVDYGDAKNTLAKAAELTKGTSDTLKKVEKIYDYVVKNVAYDTQKASTVQSGYLPVLDDVLSSKKGICFDYASLMAGMLRSNGIPCKLVVGYAGTSYHAWISVWTEESGWLDDVIWFDGESWQRMDPTFASANGGNSAVMQYIGDGSNYTPKYVY